MVTLAIAPWTVDVFSAVLALVGALGGVLLAQHLQSNERARTLRNALEREIGMMDWVDDFEVDEEMVEYGLTHTTCLTDVFEGNVDDVGLLDDEMMDRVIVYYNDLFVLREQLQRFDRGNERLRTKLQTTINDETIPRVSQHRNDALESLQDDSE